MTLRLLHYSDLENAADDPEHVGRFVGAVDALRDDDTLVVGTGDDLAPGVLSAATDGRHALDVFEALRPDAETFGNHDFEVGRDDLRAVVRDSPQPWLCANVEADGERVGASAGVEPWTVVEAGGHRVGLVGVLDPDTPEYTPSADDLTVSDPAAAVEAAAAELRPGVDFLVVLSHTGREADLADELDADAIVGGHAHSRLVEVVDGVPAVRPGARGNYVAEVLVGPEPTATLHDVSAFPVHDGVVAALRDRLADAGLDEVVATAPEPVPREHAHVVAGESRAGNLVTDAYRWATGADVAVVAPGGLREGSPFDGEVRIADLRSLSPFDNDLSVVELDGERLLETLRDLSLTHRDPAGPRAPFGHVAGAELAWDDDADELLDATVGGEPVDPDASYSLACSEYDAWSDHVFAAFGPDDVVETRGSQADALVAYAREEGVAPAIEGRVRRPNFDGEGAFRE